MATPHGPRVRRFFPGGNTAYGFYSFYDQIIAPDATRILIIKGGPGVGKSSFMGAIAEEMAARGFAVELLHCSSDNDSLDGAAFPEIRVAMIDGTAPHVFDPRNPGCVDEILHLGDYWDEAGITGHKEAILAVNREVGGLFARAYRFLRAAKEIRDAWSTANAEHLRLGAANILADRLIAAHLNGRPVAEAPGRIRRLFASALTPDGPVNYLPTIFGDARELVILSGGPGKGKSTLLAKFAAAAVERGLAMECFHCGFDPARLEHLYLPELELGLVTSNDYHRYPTEGAARILEMDGCLAPIAKAETAEDDRFLFADLLQRAFTCLRKAKETHDAMEGYYVPHMDFAAVDALREKTMARILAYAGRVVAEPAIRVV